MDLPRADGLVQDGVGIDAHILAWTDLGRRNLARNASSLALCHVWLCSIVSRRTVDQMPVVRWALAELPSDYSSVPEARQRLPEAQRRRVMQAKKAIERSDKKKRGGEEEAHATERTNEKGKPAERVGSARREMQVVSITAPSTCAWNKTGPKPAWKLSGGAAWLAVGAHTAVDHAFPRTSLGAAFLSQS